MRALSTQPKTRPVGMIKLVLLGASFVSFLLSVYLYFIADDKSAGIFVGIWVPSIQSLGALLLAGERSPR